MITFPLKDFNDIHAISFLTKKTGTIYAYSIFDVLYIGTAEELIDMTIYESFSVEDYYDIDGITLPKTKNSFLVKLKICAIY